MSEAIRARVAKYGLKVRCSKCNRPDRHRPEADGRLAQRPCPKCGARLRMWSWRPKQGRAVQPGAVPRF